LAFLAMRSGRVCRPAVRPQAQACQRASAPSCSLCAKLPARPPVSVEPIVAWDGGAEEKETADVKRALLDTLATPGVAGARRAMSGQKDMLNDDNDEVQKAAVAAAGTTAEGAVAAGKLLAAKKLPTRFAPRSSPALRKHAAKDTEAAKLLAKLAPKE